MNYIKYLGPHIQYTNSKISRILFRLSHFLTLNTLKQIYYSLIYPYLHYGIMSWGNISRFKQNKIYVYATYFLAIIEKVVHSTSNF